MALTLSIIALLATFYQLYLQRIHNEKSLKPLVQIDLVDQNGEIAVRVQNNGIGPFIVKRLSYLKGGETYDNIENCLLMDARSYQHISPLGSSIKTILPGNNLMVFSLNTDKETDAFDTREKLSMLTLKVEGVDIYDNKIIAERDLIWFVRHH